MGAGPRLDNKETERFNECSNYTSMACNGEWAIKGQGVTKVSNYQHGAEISNRVGKDLSGGAFLSSKSLDLDWKRTVNVKFK